ncbi:hypothetical protein BGW42_000958 [Actinomortierella wolfii]|nr:hypothetical protein BGW42_000958 [Actinomortierella wolfii]
MPDDHVQPFIAQDHQETKPPAPAAQPVNPPSIETPLLSVSNPAKQAPANSAPDHDGNSDSAALKPSPIKHISPQEPTPSTGDTYEQVLELLREYAQHDAALPIAAGIGVFGILLKLFSWSQWLIAVLGILAGVFGSAYFMFALPESSNQRRSVMLAGFGQGLFEHKETRKASTNNDAEVLLGDSTTGVASVQSAKPLSAKVIETSTQRYDRVQIASDIDPMAEQMITYFLRDFVNVPLGLASEGEHNNPLRASLATMFMNLSKKLTGMRLPETPLLGVFGLQNNFIVHLRAYRELRDSRMPIEEYVAKHANSDSVLGRCYRKDERQKQYRSIAKAVCQSLLAKDDQQSIALFAVLQEIMATHVIGATLDHMCDPDFVNQTIVDYFTEKPAEQETPSTAGDKRTHRPDHDAPITALADSILTNAASLMGQRQLESAPEAGSPALNSRGSGGSVPDNHPFKEVLEFEQISAPRTAAVIAASTTSPSKPAQTMKEYAHDAQKDSVNNHTRPFNLRDVIAHRDQHVEVYHGFMQYLQVWDAVDLFQFYSTVDLYHRQIREGMLTSESELEQEAASIFDLFCNPSDPDRQISGLKHAQNGALYKSLARNVRREPATCFHEVQEWAYQTLERQYWQPWLMTRAAQSNTNSSVTRDAKSEESLSTTASGSPSGSSPRQPQADSVVKAPASQVPTNENQCIETTSSGGPRQNTPAHQRTLSESPRNGSLPPVQAPTGEVAQGVSPKSLPASSLSPPTPPSTASVVSQSSAQKMSSIASIHITDLTNQRPKTLISIQEQIYMLEIQAENGHGYMVSRTYQQLESLHTSLVAQHPAVQRTVFPRWLLQPSDKVCLSLETFLQSMLTIPEVRDSPRFAWFLSKEYDQSPDGVFPGDISSGIPDGSPNSQHSSGNIFSANLAGAGNAAAKNAKMAFKQASDASMAVGSFFKNLGGQIGSVIVTDEDRTPAFFRNSSESQRSVNSVHAVNPTAGHGSASNHTSATSPALRAQPSMRNLTRTASSDSVQSVQSMRSFMSLGSTVVDSSLTRHNTLQSATETAGSPLNPLNPSSRRSTVDESTPMSDSKQSGLTDVPSQHSLDYNSWNDADAQRRSGTFAGHERCSMVPPAPATTSASTSDLPKSADAERVKSISQDDQSDRASVMTLVSLSESNGKPATATTPVDEKRSISAPSITNGNSPTSARASTPVPSKQPAKTEPPALLSSDELDLLIETTFTVLEDMLDFTRGQAIRRMTFGVLRELVRKSYRTAINQSFSEWALQNTSHEYAVELLRWMKDDFFWPNGEWPAAPAVESHQGGSGNNYNNDTQQSDSGGSGGGSRTEEEKAATREEARRLMRRALPASMVAVLGKDACVRAMTDVFEMLQIRELNLGLAMSVFDMVVRLVLTK